MRAVRGAINGILMVTLIKPIVRVMVGRWRRRAQESPAAVIGMQVQELFEAALVEELAPSVADLETAPADIAEVVDSAEVVEEAGGRSKFRLLLLAFGVAVAVAATFAVVDYIRERREAQAREAELITIPVEPDPDEAIDDVVQEALVEGG